MMKTAKLLATMLMTAGAVVSFSSIASAGEGGAAGSVSVIMNSSTPATISQLSAAAAVGKLNAAAATNSAATETFASAYGSGGKITVTAAGTSGVGYVGADETTASLGAEQKNTLTATLATIDATKGTVTIP